MKAIYITTLLLGSIFLQAQPVEIVNQSDSIGRRQGMWVLRHENDKMSLCENFVDGKRQGMSLQFYNNGMLHNEFYFKDDLSHGTQRIYDNVGRIVNLNSHYLGKLDGVQIVYYPSGNKQEEMNFKMNVKHGPSVWYYQNEDTAAYYDYVDGNIHGKVKSYYEGAHIKSIATYQENKQQGAYVSYHENGAIREKGMYVYDKREGKFYIYDENGKLLKKETYIKGEKK